LTGLGVVFTSAALGAGYHYLRRKNPDVIKPPYLLVFGVIVHVFMLLWMLTLPWSIAFKVLHKISIPVMLIFPLDQEEHFYAQKALRESEQFMRDLLESIQDGISVLNTDLTIRHVNEVMNQWYAENLPLEGEKCYECYHDADKPCDPCPTLRCIESGETEWDVVPGLPGSPAEWIELYSHPMKDPNSGEVTGVMEFPRKR